jgi:hypothetical protein
MPNRISLSKKVRFEIFKRDSFTCQYCGKSAPEVILHADHIMPVSKGGDSDITNLITACDSCNQGKSDIQLDDNAVMEKRKRQLDELQERREQIEMMYEWHSGLLDIDNDSTEVVCMLFNELVPSHSINENGQASIKKLIKKYTLNEVIESLKISASQYLEFIEGEPTQESVNKTYTFIEKICRNRKKLQEKPYLADLYRVANIIKYKIRYYEHWRVMNLLESAHYLGADYDDLEFIARQSENWYQWEDSMNHFISKLENDNGK